MIPARRNFIRNSIFATAGFSALHNNLFANLLFDDPSYKMNALRNKVGYFTERGGTIGWMITKNGIVVVDTQFPEQSQH